MGNPDLETERTDSIERQARKTVHDLFILLEKKMSSPEMMKLRQETYQKLVALASRGTIEREHIPFFLADFCDQIKRVIHIARFKGRMSDKRRFIRRVEKLFQSEVKDVLEDFKRQRKRMVPIFDRAHGIPLDYVKGIAKFEELKRRTMLMRIVVLVLDSMKKKIAKKEEK